MERAFKGIWIPKEIWLNENLTLLEKVFLVEIDSLDNEEGCYASNEYFSGFFKLSKNRCSEVIKSLEKKGLVKVSYKYKPNTKLIEKRIIKILEKSSIGIRDIDEGTRNLDRGYSENLEDNNTVFNNTNNNSKYIDKENTPNKLKEFSNLYEQNIGLINGITAEYLIELSETIDVDLFKRSIEIATDKGKCSLGYIKGIIKQWLDVNIKTLEQLEAYKLQQHKKKGVKTNGSSTKRTKQFEQQIPADDEKDEEYYRLLEECERLSRE